MMILSKLCVESFKRINKVDLDLANVTVLVGANGSGKSSIIQAIHLACCVLRQADRIEATKTSTVGVDELDYLPTDDYKTLGHKGNWGNKSGTSSSKVSLTFSEEGENYLVSCELRSARNAGISITGAVPSELTDVLRKKKNFFSGYIPGISGIPNSEERKAKKVVLKACSYGDSNVILRNALLLLKEQNRDNITVIEDWIGRIIGPVKINVEHDDERDFIINCSIEIDDDIRPIELVGTGYLQLLQVFSYVLLFKPGILLIDEPDIHLHPTVQEKLVQVLAGVAAERKLRILLTTHSPFIVRGAPPSTKVYWVNAGEVESRNRSEAELALGWGVFGKKIIIASEDKNTSLLRKLISQWPDIDRLVTFLPGNGYKNIISAEQADEINKALGGKYKIFMHRDRDSLTDEEVQELAQNYLERGIYLWFPELSDIEAYFCKVEFLELFLGCEKEEANKYVSAVLDRQAIPIRTQFDKQRTAHNEEIYKAGGSPTNEIVWKCFQNRFLKGAKGKYIFGQLKNQIPGNMFSSDLILDYELNGVLALDLKHKLEQILAE